MCLVFGSLIFDGLTSSQTDKEHTSSGRDYAYLLMFSSNLVSLVGNITFYLWTVAINGDDTFMRVISDQTMLTNVLLIGTSGAIG